MILSQLAVWLWTVALLNTANRAIDKKKYVMMNLLDVKRALGINLVYNLITLDFPIQIIKTIYMFLKDRFRAKFGGSVSSSRMLAAGVPQESLLSPVLFNVYTYDLLDSVTNNHYNTVITCYDHVAVLTKSAKQRLIAINYRFSLYYSIQEALDCLGVYLIFK